uniref:GST C-terminal domain-containing protein n=1 Tax=Oncorhynchus tshawytscha TaxID=74940 RepID=A0A8C8FNM6_ONCTS
MQQVPAVQIDGITLSQSNLYMLQKIGAEKVQWAHHFIQRGFEALEPILKETAGKYCVGDEVRGHSSHQNTVDLSSIYNAERFKVDVDQFPTIKRLNQTLLKVDAFKESHPSCQLDTPAEICT